ncbi:hypothetical protein [Pleionea sediminis]|uniref:hypothetical protein n=1 Tax=Pleionea sediminis TaxID=2569479 RepID=UPI0013DE26E0|nr:hypothetical protein [Pleionea sediminis]
MIFYQSLKEYNNTLEKDAKTPLRSKRWTQTRWRAFSPVIGTLGIYSTSVWTIEIFFA